MNLIKQPIHSATVIILLWISVIGWNSLPAQEPQRRMAVTIDDLPYNTLTYNNIDEWELITNRLLGKISAENIPVVGFVNEGKLYKDGVLDSARVDLLHLWLNANIELGNHTLTHIDLHHNSLTDFEENVIEGEKITKVLLAEKGWQLRYFRHPYLHTGRDLETKHELENFLKERGYTIAPVTIDNSEWIFARAYDNAYRDQDSLKLREVGESYLSYMEDKIAYYERQSNALFGYDLKQVLLIHINRLNADYFDKLVEMMKKREYQFITLGEALEDPAYLSEDTFTGGGGISWLDRWALTRGKRGEFFQGEPRTPEFILELAGVESE